MRNAALNCGRLGSGQTRVAAAAVCTLGVSAGISCAQSPFATRVVAYSPAPGQQVNNPLFNDPSRALGPPVGGGLSAPDNTKLVTLGGFGGTITLGFDAPIVNRPASPHNPRGLDFIVYGNAFYPMGDASRRFAEPAVVEVSRDVNGNGLADDPWYLIIGSHLAAPAARTTQTWDDNFGDATNPPSNPTWIPPASFSPWNQPGPWTTSGYLLPASLFVTGQILPNPNGPGSDEEGVWGYADMTPTMVLGDTDGDGVPDNAEATAASFYTKPDDPLAVGVSHGAGGGDAFDISWAVDPVTGASAGLTSIDFVRLTTGPNVVHPFVGEMSSEIGGVARVLLPGDFDNNGTIEPTDIASFVNAWLADLGGSTLAADFDGNGATEPADIAAFVNAWLMDLGG